MQGQLIELRTVEIFIPGQPVPQGSMVPFIDKRTKKANLKPDNERELMSWRRNVTAHARIKWPGSPTNNPIRLDVVFWFSRTKLTAGGPQRLSGRVPCNRTTPDRDKLLRAVQDALTGVVYVDDSRAIAGETEKRFVGPKERPGVLLRIEELPE